MKVRTAAQILAEIGDEVQAGALGRPREYDPVCSAPGCTRPHQAYGFCTTCKSRYYRSPDFQRLPPCADPRCARIRAHKITSYNRRTWHRSGRWYEMTPDLQVWRDGEEPMILMNLPHHTNAQKEEK